jgi:1A family penicillin-binding protein
MRVCVGRRWGWIILAALGFVLLAAVLGLYFWLLADLPALDDLYSYTSAPSSKVYDRYGRLLFEFPPPHTGRHSPVALDEMPEALQQALIATEDATFYQNPGVDGWAILRAVWINVRGGEILSGGSTLTQQLARNLLMSPDERYQQTLTRKLREAILAWRISRNYTKDQILELYLNEIYFGNLAYGVEAAAQAYFGKNVRDLDLAECALLAGLPQSPIYYNPLENLEQAKARQAVVLDLMVRHGYLEARQAQQAKNEPLYFAAAPIEIHAPHFVMYVRAQLEEKLGLARLEQGGLEIYTTLDLDLNETARDLVRQRLTRLAQCDGQRADCPPGGHNVRNAALVALDPSTGEILAMLGSPDYFSAEINGAVNGATSLRQPGSSIKPITYAAAFEKGTVTPATMMLDVRTSFVTKEGSPYVPLNYDLLFRGPVRLREALASSYNLIAVKVLDTIGPEAMTNLARRMGITTLDDPNRLGLAVTLGGGEVRLLELTTAYASFANGGLAVEPVAILRVQDAEGHVLMAAPSPAIRKEQGSKRVLDERVAYLITDILSDNTARIPGFGETSVLALSRPAAVKTGTTTDFRDNWTVGYTPQMVVGVWAGNADNQSMREISGVSGAAPIWHDFMETALRGQPALAFAPADGLVEVEVCALSGLLPGPDCPHRITEKLLPGTEPTATCTMHQRIALDRATGLRATDDTPPERVVERFYTILPPEAQQWARDNGLPEPPPLLMAQAGPEDPTDHRGNRALRLNQPDEGAVYRLDPGLAREAQRIPVSALVAGNVPLTEVMLEVDGQVLARFTSPPFETYWQLETGPHVFVARGMDHSGNEFVSEQVRVQVQE